MPLKVYLDGGIFSTMPCMHERFIFNLKLQIRLACQNASKGDTQGTPILVLWHQLFYIQPEARYVNPAQHVLGAELD